MECSLLNMENSIFIGATAEQVPVRISGRMGNRHGLIAGATGTGKTVTLQTLVEGFSQLGTTVFAADVKGDLAGLARAGGPTPKLESRQKALGLSSLSYRASPVVLWDLEGKSGHPVRTTVSEMGPLLLARLLELSEAQSDALQLTFQLADRQGLLLLDLKDLQAMGSWMSEHPEEVAESCGKIASTTLGSLQRKLTLLHSQVGIDFFGEPALEIRALLRSDLSGQGLVHLLDARQLIQQPRLYATFMLAMLSELFEDLEEVGDLDHPRLVFFFDEAHLLFNEMPKALVEKIEQVVRLIRSKGVGIYFVTQNPLDLPEAVLGQLGNRVQHALRAFTPQDQKAVRAAAQTFRTNPAFSVETAITELAVGEALVSCLQEDGSPGIVQRTLIAPPASRIGPITDEERREQMQRSPYAGVYDQAVDRESAYERLKQARQETVLPEKPAPVKSRGREPESLSTTLTKSVVRSVGSAIGSSLGRQLIRGLLGSLLGGRR